MTLRDEIERRFLRALLTTLADYPQVDAPRFVEAVTGRYLRERDREDDDFTPGCNPPAHPLGEVHRWAQHAADGAYHFPGKPELRRALRAAADVLPATGGP